MQREPTYEELKERVRTLEVMNSQNSIFRAALHFTVSPKGGISIYGLRRRFPITLYPEELMMILLWARRLIKFSGENLNKLSFRDFMGYLEANEYLSRNPAGPNWNPVNPFTIDPVALRKAHLEVQSGNYKFGE